MRRMSREPQKLAHPLRSGEAAPTKPATAATVAAPQAPAQMSRPLGASAGTPGAPSGPPVVAQAAQREPASIGVTLGTLPSSPTSAGLSPGHAADLQHEIEDLRRRNAELAQFAELAQSGEASCRGAEAAAAHEAQVLRPGLSGSARPTSRLQPSRSRDPLEVWDPERMQEVTAELFRRHDMRKCGHLSWKSGEVMTFLDDFFRMHDYPTPRLPTPVFLNIYDQVKTDSGSGDKVEGLGAAEMCDFVQQVHKFVVDGNGLRAETLQQRAEHRRTSSAVTAGAAPRATAAPAVASAPQLARRAAGAVGGGTGVGGRASPSPGPAAAPLPQRSVAAAEWRHLLAPEEGRGWGQWTSSP